MVPWAENFYGRGSESSTLPNTLTRLQGGVRVSYWPTPEETGCYETLRLINTGNNPVQIQSLEVRLAATPQQNKMQYRLVDICSLLKIYDNCSQGRAGPEPFSYYVKLNPGNAGKLFSLQGNPTQELNVLQPIIYPNDVVDIEIFFNSSPNNLIYSIIPDIVYNTSNSSKTALSLSSSTLYFADSSNFSCYTLQGDTFVDVSKIKLATWKGWCI